MSLESLDGKKKKGGLSGVSFRHFVFNIVLVDIYHMNLVASA